MPRPSEVPAPTGRELEILKVLWDRGPCSVRAVHEHLIPDGAEAIALNTVQTLLRIMATKGLVTYESEGRSFIYQAAYSRQQSAARFLDRVFDGAASELMMSLLDGEHIPDDELARIVELISVARKRRK